MDFSVSGGGAITGGEWSALHEMAQANWPKELARLKELSLVTGGEVVLDLAMFEEDWSPAYRHDSDDPVAWVNRTTGERVAGSTQPNAS